ncbi:MAG: MarR family transcriptional regulator [Acidimicrobiales bacterium]
MNPPDRSTSHAEVDLTGYDAVTDAWPGVAALSPVEPPPWLRVETTLMATARAIRQAFDHRLGALDLNLTQATMLAYVAEYGPVTQTQIADRNGVGRAATGSTIDRLEARHLVERQPDPADRRVWLVAITAQGQALVDEITTIDRTLRTQLRAGISKDERSALASVMNRLQVNVAAVLTESADADPSLSPTSTSN